MKEKTEQKERLYIYVTKEEKQQIESNANHIGLKSSAYIRMVVKQSIVDNQAVK